ncbi:hypothetical protein J4558_25805 [Leptolyngbya sp. 15MV]|nr:hypothetical protein J4558_25805 [Leptolyngbya sp. 15MV]
MADVYLLQLPSPPGRNVFREWAGGMGTALASPRTTPGHDPGFYDIPFFAFLYIARLMQQDGTRFRYVDGQAAPVFDRDGLLAQMARDAPKVLVTVVNIPSLEPDLALIRAARSAVPGLRVILLGPTAPRPAGLRSSPRRRAACSALAIRAWRRAAAR